MGPIQRVQVEDAAQTGAPVTALQNPLAVIQGPPDELRSLREDVEYAFDKVAEKPYLEEIIIDHLELADEQESQLFWRAFQIPYQQDGFTITGRNGAVMQTGHLLDRWQSNKGPGDLSQEVNADFWKI
ncbi:hypothetical protein G3M48_004444 [Beauveria asiatica]|uniref:Uncharacterized protein n=1 Tax=Beauveria asiatica TaxID=1069075 RepID=A0AAW0RTA6_9HYPO